MNHKVVVGRTVLRHTGHPTLAGLQEGRAVVELQALSAASLARRHHGEAGSIDFIQALGHRGRVLQLGAAGVSCEANLHVLQLGQTPALQLTDQGRLLKGQTQPHRRVYRILLYVTFIKRNNC